MKGNSEIMLRHATISTIMYHNGVYASKRYLFSAFSHKMTQGFYFLQKHVFPRKCVLCTSTETKISQFANFLVRNTQPEYMRARVAGLH